MRESWSDVFGSGPCCSWLLSLLCLFHTLFLLRKCVLHRLAGFRVLLQQDFQVFSCEGQRNQWGHILLVCRSVPLLQVHCVVRSLASGLQPAANLRTTTFRVLIYLRARFRFGPDFVHGRHGSCQGTQSLGSLTGNLLVPRQNFFSAAAACRASVRAVLSPFDFSASTASGTSKSESSSGFSDFFPLARRFCVASLSR